MLRIAFAGTPDFAVPALEALAASSHSLVGALTQPDRPAGRGRGLSASPVKQRAEALGVPVAQPGSLKSPEDRRELESWHCELLVVVAYGLLLPPAVLSLPRLGCLNIHASLLPRWRGAAPIQRAMLAGDAETGVSIMQMDAGLDTGPVLAERHMPIGAGETAGELQQRLAQSGAALLIETIGAIEEGRVQAVPQSTQGVTYAAKISKQEARIDWSQAAERLERQVLAFNPRPVAETRWQERRVRLWRARAAPYQTLAAPGTVLGLVEDALHVACGRGVLAVTELQMEGRRALPACEFARGQSLAGARFD